MSDKWINKQWGLQRCELTDLLKENCAHCRGDTLGDEEDTTHGQFDGLLRKSND